MKRLVTPILVLFILAACATFTSGYRAASITANENAKAYAAARLEVDDLQSSGKLTAVQSARYQEIRSAVRAAGLTHDRSITQWRESGRKPADYDAAAAALKAAEQLMIDLRNEVIR